jgi:exodeoxyribonuclease VII small subunit
MAKETEIDVMGFEAAIRRLEQTVAELESGELGLDGALASYEVGVRILKRCYGLLESAERTVAILTGVGPDGQPLTSPFDATATLDREAPFEARGEARAWPNTPRPAPLETDEDDDSIPF